MLPYFFKIPIKPTPGTPKAADVEAGFAHIWVMAESFEEAEANARSYLMSYAWIAGKTELSRQMPDELIPQLGKEERALYEKALRLGIAADMLVWPKKARPHNTPVEVRLMGSPLQGGSDQE